MRFLSPLVDGLRSRLCGQLTATSYQLTTKLFRTSRLGSRKGCGQLVRTASELTMPDVLLSAMLV